MEFAEALDNKIPLGVEVAGPLLEGEEIAVTVVEDLQRSLAEHTPISIAA